MKPISYYFKRLGFIVLVFVFLTSVGQTKEKSTITVKNFSKFDRNELISIPYTSFLKIINAKLPSFKLVNKENGKEYAYQLEMLGKSEVQNILIQVMVPASKQIQLVVVAGEPQAIVRKTFARYVPERFDDFAWENDVVAYRMYGKGLEGRGDDAQGMDIWAKRTQDLIINKWYKSKDYHKDHGDGLDYYSVGQTLGAGDVAAYADGVLYYSKHYRKYDILDNGPLRTTFRLDFEPWKVKENNVRMSKTISIDAGSQLNKIILDFNFDQSDRLTIAAGIARRARPGMVLDAHKKGIFGYWEPEHGKDGVNGIIGVGVVFNDAIDSVKVTESQYLTLFEVQSQKPVIYYAGGVWNKAGKITSATEWLNYLKQQKAILKAPLKIKID